ncbi:DNA-binding transcriptional regulator, LysR family [Micromonospora pallida]|uniref:DNA-binding transcriptional regulator, LysR family n=1 Tax=Micromonospora pallida TaxID=145854 RepID=A0A1C6RJP5_9ACTN|nr:LysR family transcriptional regulator [Micromonospora pallida]SCL17401.1 DNA-binding transcriptional regulator, LysR family [Micromonospora pallida]
MDLLRHLRHFAVAAEELHFGRAAELLGIAQPPLSQSIQRLERELGVDLFDRSRRQVALTAAGRLLRDEARGLLAGEERMRALMHLVRDGKLGTLRAGVPPETPAVTLQALLRHLAEQVPGLDVDLQELTTGEQLRMLADARLDVGLVHHPVDAPDLRFGPTVRVPLGVLLPRGSPLARLPELALADLAGHGLVLPPRVTASGWHDHVLDVCRQHGFTPARIRHARNPEFLLGLVLAGHGVAFQPESVARREPRVVWRPVTGRPLRTTMSAAWPAQSPHPAAERFAEVAAATLDEGAPEPLAVPQAEAARPWSVVFAPSATGTGW